MYKTNTHTHICIHIYHGFCMFGSLPGQRNVTLFADFLRGVATARHHSTKSQTAGAEGAAAVLTAQLKGQIVHCT